MVIDNQRGRIFVAVQGAPDQNGGYGPGSIVLIDIRSKTVVRRWPNQPNPTGMALDPATGRVFVLDQSSRRVSVLDPARPQESTITRLRAPPGPVVMDATSHRLFILLGASPAGGPLAEASGLVAIDTAHDRLLWQTWLHITAWGTGAVALDNQLERLFVLIQGEKTQPSLPFHTTLQVVCARDGRLQRTVVVSAQHLAANVPLAMALDQHTHHLFVAAQVNEVNTLVSGTVTMYDGRTLRVLTKTAVGMLPATLAIDQQRKRVMAVDTSSNEVSILDAVAGTLVKTIPVGYTPSSMVVDDQSGRTFVANTTYDVNTAPLPPSAISGTVSVLDTSAGTLLGTVSVPVGPILLALDGQSGQLFVAGQANPYGVTGISARLPATFLQKTNPPPAQSPFTIQWLRVDPQQPRTVYIGGNFQCPGDELGDYGYCGDWALRSLDGGHTWIDLRNSMHVAAFDYAVWFDPPSIAPDSHHVYMEYGTGAGDNIYRGLIWSSDGGNHWQVRETYASNQGHADFVVSPISSTRLYGNNDLNGSCWGQVSYSDDMGRTWHDGGTPGGTCYPSALIPSLRRPDTLFVNSLLVGSGTSVPVGAQRSDDAGLHWTQIITPVASPPLHTFSVDTASWQPGLLIGRTNDRQTPHDLRYFSHNGGRTWTRGICPGAVRGQCPTAIVTGVFGAGSNYAFVANGIYRFRDDGAAVGQLQGVLPFPSSAIVACSTGRQPGEPVYMLVEGQRGPMHNLLYATFDRGRHWILVGMPTLMHLQPISPF